MDMVCFLCPVSKNCNSLYTGKPDLSTIKVVSWNNNTKTWNGKDSSSAKTAGVVED